MIGSKRVNLSLTVRTYRALSDYAEIVGRTRTALVVEAIGYQLPHWEHAVRSKRAHEWQVDNQGAAGAKLLPGAKAAARNEKAMWNAERERKAAAKAVRRAKAAKR